MDANMTHDQLGRLTNDILCLNEILVQMLVKFKFLKYDNWCIVVLQYIIYCHATRSRMPVSLRLSSHPIFIVTRVTQLFSE